MQPLTPQGGEAEKVYAKVPRGDIARIDQAAQRRGMTRSEFIRLALSQVAYDEDQGVTASAS
jgi:Ribbon-helix-helix protein, copG family